MLIRVCGEVQYTGFRRFVWRASKLLGLRGYVRNLPDGCVEILAVGGRGEIESLLRRITGSRVFEVASVEARSVELEGEPEDFEIR